MRYNNMKGKLSRAYGRKPRAQRIARKRTIVPYGKELRMRGSVGV